MVEGETIKHFAHIEVGVAGGAGCGFSDLFKHCIVVDVDLNKRSVLPVNEGEVAIGAVVWTAVGNGN